MKHQFLIICVLIFLGCQDEKKLIEGNWVLESRFMSNPEEFNFYEKEIYKFSADSLSVKYLSNGSNYFNKQSHTSKCVYRNNKIIVNSLEGIDTFKIHFVTSDSLILVQGKIYKIFSKLEKGKELKTKNGLLSKLKESIYSFEYHDEPMELEFLNDSLYITNSVHNDFTTPLFFNIVDYENELFLNFHSSSGPCLQLLRFDGNKLIFKLYARKYPDISFVKIDRRKKHSNSELIGRWEEISIERTFDNSYEPEYLEISDSIIKKKGGYWNPEEASWFLNKSGEIIIFDKVWKRERKFQWNIIELNQQNLVLEKRMDDASVKKVRYRKLIKNDM
jgi:hypothetical protein